MVAWPILNYHPRDPLPLQPHPPHRGSEVPGENRMELRGQGRAFGDARRKLGGSARISLFEIAGRLNRPPNIEGRSTFLAVDVSSRAEEYVLTVRTGDLHIPNNPGTGL